MWTNAVLPGCYYDRVPKRTLRAMLSVSSSDISRRAFLKALGLGTAGVTAAAALTACGGSASSAASGSTAAASAASLEPVKDGIGVITPNPKTSGGARWNYLAAWYYFEKAGQSEDEIIQSMSKLYKNMVVLDSGARGATTSFVENGQGDVLLAWENEAFLSLDEYPGKYEIVYPSVSILCQPTVAVVDEVVDKHGTREVATEYLNYLYSDEAQKIEAENFYRPSTESILKDYTLASDSKTITEIPADGKWIITDGFELTNIAHFGGWTDATAKHFADGGIFDTFYDG